MQLLTVGRRQGIGFSRFIGSGNAANTYISDYLEFLEQDELTRVILLYIEGLKEGRRFLEVARRVAPHKPIIALKSGKGELGSRAVRSHSGALAGTFELFRGMTEQAGIIEAETTEELMDLAAASPTCRCRVARGGDDPGRRLGRSGSGCLRSRGAGPGRTPPSLVGGTRRVPPPLLEPPQPGWTSWAACAGPVTSASSTPWSIARKWIS